MDFVENPCMDKSPEVPDSSQALPCVATGTNWNFGTGIGRDVLCLLSFLLSTE